MEKPEINLLITALAPEPVRHHGKSGGHVRLVEILRWMEKSDRVKIFCVATPHNRKNFEENGIRAEFKIVKTNLKFKDFFGLCLKSLFMMTKAFFLLKWDFLKKQEGKIAIYSSSDLFWEVISAYFAKRKRKDAEWVQVIHHIYPDWRKRPGRKMVNFFGYHLQKFSFWLAKKKADKIIVLSNIVKKELIQKGFPENKIFISSNGVDIDHFESVKMSESEYEGVFLGRLNPSKGIADLVEIWKNVSREIPGAKLAVIGGEEAEMKNYLRKKIKEFELEENIRLLGYMEDEKAHPILKSGKVFLFPSREEGWGIAIAEAMACGLPVVSWNLPVFKEIFEGYTIQINENDISAFSEKVVELLRNDELRKKTGKDGKEFIKKYSWERVTERELEAITPRPQNQ